jgi:hypothetical protein
MINYLNKKMKIGANDGMYFNKPIENIQASQIVAVKHKRKKKGSIEYVRNRSAPKRNR